MKRFPRWFWYAILAFILLSWLAIPITNMFAYHARDVVMTIFIFGAVIYPAFAIVTLTFLYRKTKLDSDEKIWAFLFILIPIFTYFPLWLIF